MTITIELSPDTERKLLAEAAASGKDVKTLIHEAIEEKLRSTPPGFGTLLAPVHEDFRKSGMTEAELDTVLREALSEVRGERRRTPDRPS